MFDIGPISLLDARIPPKCAESPLCYRVPKFEFNAHTETFFLATNDTRTMTLAAPPNTTEPAPPPSVATRLLHPSAWTIAHRFNIDVMTSTAFAAGSAVAPTGGKGDSGSAARASTIMASLYYHGIPLLSWHPSTIMASLECVRGTVYVGSTASVPL